MGKVTQEFGEVLADLPGSGRLSQVQGEVLGTPAAQGRLSQVQGEVLGTVVAQGRLSNILGEVLWPFLLPVAVVPDITGLRNIPATFDASASTGGYGNDTTLSYRWSWTAVPGGSTIANISPTAMPDSGGTTFIAMTSNSVLYHGEVAAGTDSSGNGNTATFSNATSGVAAGKVGSFAWSFTTTAGVASTTTNLDCTGDYSFACWFFDLGADGGFRSALHSAAGVFIPLIVDPSNLLGLYNGAFQSSGFSMNAANFTGWHHIAIVASGSTTLFYVDGVLAGSVPIKLSNALKYIGNQNGSSQRFALRMDEIAFWTRALSAAEIGALWLNQVGGYAGVGVTFLFTPDVIGTYTVQLSVQDNLRPVTFPAVNDSANAEITNVSFSGVWPQELITTMPSIQGQRLKPRRGQL